MSTVSDRLTIVQHFETQERYTHVEDIEPVNPSIFFHSDSLILTLSFFARSNAYSDDDDCTEKAMLLIDVCFGEQISLARDEIPPEGIRDYDTVSVLFTPGCISLLFIYFFASGPNSQQVVKRTKLTGGWCDCVQEKCNQAIFPRPLWLIMNSSWAHCHILLILGGTVIATTLVHVTESTL